MIHFLRPYWLLAILPILLLCWKLSQQNLVDNWRRFCDPHLLKQLLVAPKHRLILPIVALALSCVIGVIALAGPSWHQETQAVYRASQGTVLALNLSPSMSEKLGTTTKIDRARFKLLDYLTNKKDGLTGLVVYTDEAHTISPLTEDSKTIANFIPSLDPNIMPTFSDDTVKGLEEATNLFKQAGISVGNIILITDKVTNEKTADVARSLLKEGYRVNILDLSDDSTKASELKQVASAGGGLYVPISPNNKDIDKLIAQTKVKSWASIKKTDEQGRFWHDDGRWLVFLLLPLALAAFRKGYL